MKKKLGKIQKTSRGFELIEFNDYNGKAASLQQSSLAIYTKPGISAVWLGPDENSFHSGTKEPMSPRMHLNRKQVQALITHLTAWLKKGTFKA
jgi:hypothetical protein